MKQFRRVLISLIMVALVFATACTPTPSSKSTDQSTDQPATAAPDASDKGPYWVGDIDLTLWCSFDGKGFDNISSFEEIWSFQQLEKLTGVNINWLHPPVGQEKEQFNLIVASGDYPDLMYYDLNTNYPGGAPNAVEEGVFLDLTDYITPEKSPYITALYEKYPQYRKNAVSDEGKFYMYPRVDGCDLEPENDYISIYNGPQYRIDWAESLGIAPPDTIDEWHDLLLAFKQGDPNGNGVDDEIPLVAQRNLDNWMPMFGILSAFYMDGDKINYGPLNEKYYDFLATMRQWYQEGIIDKDYLATDGALLKNKIVSDFGGAIVGGIGGNFGGITQAFMGKYNDKVVWGTTKWPVSADGTGKRYHPNTAPVTFEMGSGLSIFSTNKYPDLSAKWCDINFAPEISDMLCFGEKGVTYDITPEGEYVIVEDFKKKMLAASDANTVICEIAQAAMNSWGTIISPYYYVIQWVIPGQFEAAVSWNVDRCDELIAPLITRTAEEGTEYSNIMSQVETYVIEVTNKIIMGEMELSEWETMVKNIEKMGIHDVIKIQNTALERFNNR